MHPGDQNIVLSVYILHTDPLEIMFLDILDGRGLSDSSFLLVINLYPCEGAGIYLLSRRDYIIDERKTLIDDRLNDAE